MNPIGRLARDLRGLRWGQVAVELLLLVVGILIALAIDDWMQDRRDTQTERQYLEGIVRDLDRDLVILKEFGDYHERQITDGIMAYRALRSEPDVKDKESVAQALSRLMSRRTLRLSHPTYSNLVGSGNIRLLRNAELRDRIVGLYEASERWVTIVDRNNQVFVDQMYLQYIMDRGLIAPRATSNLDALTAILVRFAERVALPVDTSNDRLWRLAADASEREILVGKVWQRSQVSFQAISQARDVAGEMTAVRQAIVDELERRWPGATAAPPAG
jgi:Family of unknown function (DUF6090)